MSRGWKHYGGVAIRDGASVMISDESFSAQQEVPGDRTANKGVELVEPKTLVGATLWSNWGLDNAMPEKRRLEVMKSTVAPRAIKTRMDVHFGAGIVTYKRELVEGPNGQMSIKKVLQKFDEFEAFARKNDITFTQRRVIMDYEWFANFFVQLRTSRDQSKITNYYHQQATHTRLAKMDRQGRIRKCYFSFNWPSPTKSNYKELPLLDPTVQQQPKLFVMHGENPMPGHDYYPLPTWDGVVQSGWLEIAALVPSLKKAVLKNQISLKYHVHIPSSYWPTIYSNWSSMTPEDQMAKKNEFYDAIDKFLSDIDNTGKSFFSEFLVGIDGKAQEGFKIEVIDNKIKDGQLLPDSFGANTEILWAIGVNPVLIGMVPSGSMGAGSGSNIREAFHTLQALMAADRAATLAPLRFIRDYNGWDPEMEFGYLDIQTWQTLNQSKDKGKEAIDGTD